MRAKGPGDDGQPADQGTGEEYDTCIHRFRSPKIAVPIRTSVLPSSMSMR
jgi:hypothetical protein